MTERLGRVRGQKAWEKSIQGNQGQRQGQAEGQQGGLSKAVPKSTTEQVQQQ